MFTVNNLWGTEKEQDLLSNSLFGTVSLTSFKSNEFSSRTEGGGETEINKKLKRKDRLKERKSKKVKNKTIEGSKKGAINKDDGENMSEIINNHIIHGDKVFNKEIVMKGKNKKKVKKVDAIVEENITEMPVGCESNEVSEIMSSTGHAIVERQSNGDDKQINEQNSSKLHETNVKCLSTGDIDVEPEKKKRKKKKAKVEESKVKKASCGSESNDVPVCNNIYSLDSKETHLVSNKRLKKELERSKDDKGHEKSLGNNKEVEKSDNIKVGKCQGDRKRRKEKKDGNENTSAPGSDEVQQSIEGNNTVANVNGKNNKENSPLVPLSKKFKFRDSSKYSKFQNKITQKLKGGQFRWINEKLYTCKSTEACNIFDLDPKLFDLYHNGFHSQVKQWPQNPVDIIIEDIKSKGEELLVADFGCGDAKISKCVSNQVHSFDMVAVNECVTACDMKNVPLSSNSIDIAVFCLSLMGTNLVEFLVEAHRVLKQKGILKIAEVKSRFGDIEEFIEGVSSLGFSSVEMDDSNKMFVMMEFHKSEEASPAKTANITLKPCIYKRR